MTTSLLDVAIPHGLDEDRLDAEVAALDAEIAALDAGGGASLPTVEAELAAEAAFVARVAESVRQRGGEPDVDAIYLRMCEGIMEAEEEFPDDPRSGLELYEHVIDREIAECLERDKG